MKLYKIVYDPKLKKPGCVLLQAALGGTVPNFSERFCSGNWLVSSTPDMKLFPVTEDQLKVLEEISRRKGDEDRQRET